jgi:hypothetical protein
VPKEGEQCSNMDPFMLIAFPKLYIVKANSTRGLLRIGERLMYARNFSKLL